MLANFKGGFGGSRATATRMGDVTAQAVNRITSHCTEVDRALGGGFVPGMALIVGGDPGIGKSTLCMQIAGEMSSHGAKVLYISGEENQSQLKSRADRLKVDASEIIVLVETCLEDIIRNAAAIKPDFIVLDSLQTTYSKLCRGMPGQPNQLKKVTQAFNQYAKTNNVACLMIGHVTKGGGIAGPKTLEHMVDTVLYFEGEEGMSLRTVRPVKNRFGNIQDTGIFEMRANGLHNVSDPSKLYLQGRDLKSTGSIVCPVTEGARCSLIEIQTMMGLPMGGRGSATVIGLDKRRTTQVLNVLEQSTGAEMGMIDISINVAGGLVVKDNASDLSIAVSAVSKFLDFNVTDMVCFGEIGLHGEVRPVSQCPQRVKESLRVGFKKIILPAGNMEVMQLIEDELAIYSDFELIYVEDLGEVMTYLMAQPMEN